MTISSAPSYDLFVGIDIAAATPSVACKEPSQKVSRALTIDQTPQGFHSLQQRLTHN